jgi:hypothetical protein
VYFVQLRIAVFSIYRETLSRFRATFNKNIQVMVLK